MFSDRRAFFRVACAPRSDWLITDPTVLRAASASERPKQSMYLGHRIERNDAARLFLR